MIRQQAKLLLILTAIFSLFLIPAGALAQNESRVYLSANPLDLQVGQPATVEIRVEKVSPIYGAELHLSFDPTLMEVVEINHGDFLAADPDNEAFVLQNEFDNEQGTIDYALSLLNPAPPAEGDGVLLQVTFKGKQEGISPIEFLDGLFGTQTGEELRPAVENAEAVIGPGTQQPGLAEQNGVADRTGAEKFRSDDTQRGSGTILGLSLFLGALVIIGFGGLILLAILGGLWFWMRRSRRQNKQPHKATVWS